METLVYYFFVTMALGGALGVLIAPKCVDAAMSMLASTLGVAGLMLLSGAFFPALLMVSVYAGAVLVLFVFAVMLSGDVADGVSLRSKIGLVVLWAVAGVVVAFFAPAISEWASLGQASASPEPSAMSFAKSYGFVLFKDYLLHIQIVGMMLLIAMVGVIVVAKRPAAPKRKSELL